MNDWMNDFISHCLEDVPPGKYRTRTEKELRDHMETQCQALVEEGVSPRDAHLAVWNTMGDPEKLRSEYKAAWERTAQAKLERMKECLEIWLSGFFVMGGTHLLAAYVRGCAWTMAISLPGDSSDPWVRMIRDTVGNWNNSLFWRHLFPLALALAAGAFYLGRRFRAFRFPAALISAGLCVHWTYITAFNVWWEAMDDHRTFWAEMQRHLSYNAVYYSLTFALCILLGVLFGLRRERKLA